MRIAIIGAGNIGSALLGGILKGGVAAPDDVVATVATQEHAEELARSYPVRVMAGNNLAAAEFANVIILAVKPKVIPTVLEEIRWALREDRILISLAAAFPIAEIETQLGRRMPIFRAMPNTPVIVEEGATCISSNEVATPQQRAVVEAIFRAVGVVCHIEEDLMHAATALSGSGPAYVYMVIEALIAGGLKMGLSHEVSTRLSEQTVLGAAKLVRQTMLHPAILKDQVITPGGVTISAVHELERHGLRAMLISAIETATRHSRHLSDKLIEKLRKDA
ncbi:MAG: pyrroline-5-carboxylate reductase [Bryobacterales bacterium]|nr:pyrroline-5-carboxylate reductase [Bryobacterales bacterium]